MIIYTFYLFELNTALLWLGLIELLNVVNFDKNSLLNDNDEQNKKL